MEALIVSVLLYACFAIIVYGAVLAFPAEPRVYHHHWAGVLPGDTVVLHGEERHIVKVDLDHDAVVVDRAFEYPPLPGEWVVVRHQPA